MENTNIPANDAEILEIIKQYIFTSYNGEITVDCKTKNPIAYQKLIQWIMNNKQIKR